MERIFSNLNLTWERCAEEGFEVTKNKILDEQAEKAAASVVRLFYPRSRNTSGSEMKRLSRLFLTSFIIAAHPQHVLEQPVGFCCFGSLVYLEPHVAKGLWTRKISC